MVSPAQPLPDLVSALRRAGWGPIAGSEYRPARAILDALSSNARWAGMDRASTVVVTAAQLADAAGYSVRHLRRWMPILEDIGLIEWHRGGVVEGRPRPGLLKVVKRVICQWIKDARPVNDARIERRRRETLARLKSLRMRRIPPFRRKTEVHADTASSLPPYQGRRGAPRSAPSARNSSTPPRKDNTMSTMTLDLLKMQTLPPDEFMPLVCGHGTSAPRFCNRCRYEGWTKKQANDRAHQEEAARKRAEQRKKEQDDEAAKGHAFVTYMLTTYPGRRRSEWPAIITTDPRAKELANA